MSRRLKTAIYATAALALIAGVFAAGQWFVNGSRAATAAAPTANPGKSLTLTAQFTHTVDASKLASSYKAWTGPVKTAPTLPYTNKSIKQKTAKPSVNAPKADAQQAAAANTKVNTPFQTKNFAGLNNTCNPGLNNGFSFQPADLAVATSSSWVVEAVNNCIAVYDTNGVLQAGWPKNPNTFFGVPSLGGCQALGSLAFMSDPRAAYDPNTGKFYLQWLEAEGVFGIDACPVTSFVWQAVSNTSDPRGAWTVHAFNVSSTFNSQAVAGDFDTLGFDAQGLYFSVNEFLTNGSAFETSLYCGVPKAALGSAFCFIGPSVTGSRTIFVDTMQPVLTEVPGYGPRAEYFVNTYNIEGDPFTSDCFSATCTGLVVWTFSNLANWAAGGSSPHIGVTFVSNTKTYIFPPGANDPACPSGGCADTNDLRISSTPVYSAGQVWAAWSTGITNFQDVFVPGVIWSQFRAELTDNNSGACPIANDICPDASTAYQQMGYYFFLTNDQAAYFPALMTDAESNLFMGFDTSSNSLFRSAWYVSRRATFKSGLFHDYGRVGLAGAASNSTTRWGDYSASSYDGLASDHPWVCAQYTRVANDWGTDCVQVSYSLRYP